MNINDTASKVPLFEKALKTDTTTLLSTRRRNYCDINRCPHPPILATHTAVENL